MTEEQRLLAAIPPLLEWFRQERKPLPWRGNPTPYQVWISEIMLQQTRIEAVIPYYFRFLATFPDVAALAAAPDDLLMKCWEGLGYYSRARNLKKAAQTVMDTFGGVMPSSAEDLRSLPGIGAYTAGAIASIAYGRPEPAVDGNVLRVLSRLHADGRDVMKASTRTGVEDALRQVYPRGEEAALLTEGLMELGERVCLPNTMPLCDRCPWQELCLVHKQGTEQQYPVRAAKKERRREERTVFLLRKQGTIALRKRTNEGLLAGMWEFPNVEGALSLSQVKETLTAWGLTVSSMEPCGKAKHVFSHVEWHMTGFSVTCDGDRDGLCWVTPAEIAADFALPTAFKAYKKQVEQR